MDEHDFSNLDNEFRRYKQIVQPYLAQVIEQNIIDVCNDWLHRLSNCSNDEKVLRNKYIFNLCYQLAKGILDEPFLKSPPRDKLEPFVESDSTIASNVSEKEDNGTDVFCDKSDMRNPLLDTDFMIKETGFNENNNGSCETFSKHVFDDFDLDSCNLPSTTVKTPSYFREFRATNLIMKLREIKKQNVLLHEELEALKKESIAKTYSKDSINLQTIMSSHGCNESCSVVSIKSLKEKYKEIQEYRKTLINRISNLQDRIEQFDHDKRQEIYDLEAKHQLEIMNTKTLIRNELKENYETLIMEMKKSYEDKNTTLEVKCHELSQSVDEKSKMLDDKDSEIIKLKEQVQDLEKSLQAVKERCLQATENQSEIDSYKQKLRQLERKVSRMEKCKSKFTRAYETKVAFLNREKCLTDYTLQLQLIRQRAQVVHDVTDDNATDVSTAIDKLETKYREIVANMQATAIQRRIQDQKSLDNVLRAAFGVVPTEQLFQVSSSIPGTNNHRPPPQTMRNQNIDSNLSYENELSSLLRGGKVSNLMSDVGNNSLDEDNASLGYCLNNERLGEVFGKVYIPQRDTGDHK